MNTASGASSIASDEFVVVGNEDAEHAQDETLLQDESSTPPSATSTSTTTVSSTPDGPLPAQEQTLETHHADNDETVHAGDEGEAEAEAEESEEEDDY